MGYLSRMKHFIFTISLSFGGVNGNDPSCQSGETKISVSDYSLGSAIAQLKANKNVTGILSVESSRHGAAHKFEMKL